ncbi:hypothetical protein GOV12_05845 [Candidatus Pacearchaeota archaeon]|nr:hypothetical protein [Candidatus Pacearchaeota archaeon]
MVEQVLVEGELILGTVDKIMGTTVFIKISGGSEATLTTSEIAPGRIRNLRDYVVPGKKIVCKVLNIKGDRIYLSLRRVGLNEKKDFLQLVQKEKSYKAILKTVLGDNESKEVIEKIREDYTITELFNELKINPKLIEKYVKKQEAEKIIKILESKKEKPKEIKKIFKLSNKEEGGINTIKDIIKTSCNKSQCNVSYISAGKYYIKISGEDIKKISTEISIVLENMEKQAKKTHSEFSVEKN